MRIAMFRFLPLSLFFTLLISLTSISCSEKSIYNNRAKVTDDNKGEGFGIANIGDCSQEVVDEASKNYLFHIMQLENYIDRGNNLDEDRIESGEYRVALDDDFVRISWHHESAYSSILRYEQLPTEPVQIKLTQYRLTDDDWIREGTFGYLGIEENTKAFAIVDGEGEISYSIGRINDQNSICRVVPIEESSSQPPRRQNELSQHDQFVTAIDDLPELDPTLSPNPSEEGIADIPLIHLQKAVDLHLPVLPQGELSRNLLIEALINNSNPDADGWNNIVGSIPQNGGLSLTLTQGSSIDLPACEQALVDEVADVAGLFVDIIADTTPISDPLLIDELKTIFKRLASADNVLDAIVAVRNDLTNNRHGALLLGHLGRVFLEIAKAFINDETGSLSVATATFLRANHDPLEPYDSWTNVGKPMLILAAQIGVWAATSELKILKAIFDLVVDFGDIIHDSQSVKSACMVQDPVDDEQGCWPLQDYMLIPGGELYTGGSGRLQYCGVRVPRVNDIEPAFYMCGIPAQEHWGHFGTGRRDWYASTLCQKLSAGDRTLFN